MWWTTSCCIDLSLGTGEVRAGNSWRRAEKESPADGQDTQGLSEMPSVSVPLICSWVRESIRRPRVMSTKRLK